MPKSESAHGGVNLSIVGLVMLVWQRRLLVLTVTAAFFFLGVALSLFWPKTYEATATVFPVASTGNSTLSQYVGIASMAGIDLPLAAGSSNDPTKTVIALLESRLLVETLVTDMDLVPKLNAPEMLEDSRYSQDELFNLTVENLRKRLSFVKEKQTDVIEITLSLEQQDLVQQVTNRILVVLDRLLSEKALTTTRKRSESLDRQIEGQKIKVDQLQAEMARFQTETDLIDPKTQAGQAIQSYMEMVQQKMALELQLITARSSYSASNPRLALLERQIEGLDSQINKVRTQAGGELPSLRETPENLIRYQNLARDLEIATKIYAGLLAGLEQNRLENDDEQVYIEVLDRALLPLKGTPSRVLLIVAATLLGFAIALAVCLLLFVVENREVLSQLDVSDGHSP